LPDGAGANGNGLNGSVANGPVPVAIAGHSRKGSLMVGGGMDIKRGEHDNTEHLLSSVGSIAFGTVDSPNPLLSSSPAAPSTTGAHLADTVKAFGSIDADASTDPSAVKAARRTSTLVSLVMTSPPVPGVVPPKQQLDMHALFGAKPQPNGTSSVMSPPSAVQSPMSSASVSHDRRQSMNQGPSSFQVPNGNGQPQSTAHPYQISGMPYGQNHFRPLAAGSVIGQPRSPVLGHMGPGQYNGQVLPHLQQGFRPPQQGQAGGMMQPNVPQQGQGRPNGPQPGMMLGQQRPSMLMGQQGMSAYGLHPGPSAPYSVMGYQQQGYYVSSAEHNRSGELTQSSPLTMCTTHINSA